MGKTSWEHTRTSHGHVVEVKIMIVVATDKDCAQITLYIVAIRYSFGKGRHSELTALDSLVRGVGVEESRMSPGSRFKI